MELFSVPGHVEIVDEEVLKEKSEEVGNSGKVAEAESGHTNEVGIDDFPAGDKKKRKNPHALTLTYTI